MKLTILADSHLLKSEDINGTIVQLYFLSKDFQRITLMFITYIIPKSQAI